MRPVQFPKPHTAGRSPDANPDAAARRRPGNQSNARRDTACNPALAAPGSRIARGRQPQPN